MIRTQIQLPEEQVAMLKEIAAAEHPSMAEIIRQSIDLIAKARCGGGEKQRRKRAMAAAGQFRSGVEDLAALHDSCLAEAFDKSTYLSVLPDLSPFWTGMTRIIPGQWKLGKMFNSVGCPCNNQLCSCGILSSRAKSLGNGGNQGVSGGYCPGSPERMDRQHGTSCCNGSNACRWEEKAESCRLGEF